MPRIGNGKRSMKTPMDRLIYWITERESIRKKKEAGEEAPWTDDEILSNFRFCNVCRRDDKVTRWLVDNWYKKGIRSLPEIVLARHINRIWSLDWITECLKDRIIAARTWNEAFNRLLIGELREFKEEFGTVFSAAYIIRGNDGGGDKIESVIRHTVYPFVRLFGMRNTITGGERFKRLKTSMKDWHAKIEEYRNIGSFMAGQIVADLRLAYPNVNWTDKDTWAPMGPGSKRGMNRLLGRDIKARMNQAEFEENLEWMICKITGRVPSSITDRMEAMDYQSCLCELDKYERALNGEGRPKQNYRPEGLL